MELVEIYDKLRNETSKRTDGLSPTQSKATTRWRGTDMAGHAVVGPDVYKVRVNHEDLAEDLDAYADSLQRFSQIGDAVRQATRPEYRRNHLHEDRYFEAIAGIILNASNSSGIGAEDAVDLDDFLLANAEPITAAEEPEELRYLLRENTDVESHRVSRVDLDAVYDGLAAQDANGEAGDEAWYEEIWNLVTDDSFVPVDDEFYSVQEAFQERAELNEEIADAATALEAELDRSMREELAQYRPGLKTKIARRIRR